MRVHALFGGGTKMKAILWGAWSVYAILTLVLLGIGLSHGQGAEESFFIIFSPMFSSVYTAIPERPSDLVKEGPATSSYVLCPLGQGQLDHNFCSVISVTLPSKTFFHSD